MLGLLLLIDILCESSAGNAQAEDSHVMLSLYPGNMKYRKTCCLPVYYESTQTAS